MRACIAGVFGLAALTLPAVPALAQAQDARTVEVTPYAALGTAGAAPVGVAVTFPVTSRFAIETDTAYRRGEGRIDALSTDASLLFTLPRVGPSVPYVAAGVGVAQYGAPVFSPAGAPIATQSRLATRVNLGGGLKTPLSDKLSLRTDARWFNSFGAQGAEEFRVAQGLSFKTRQR
jgi:hypothetical protein